MASQQVSHMVRLLDDLLDVSRITHGKIEMRQERVDLCRAIKQATDIAMPLITGRKKTLKAAIPDCPLWVKGDGTRLTQLFGNLLNNAAKYTPQGGSITFDLEEHESEVTVHVKDTGIGIAPEKLPYIFDMFMQVDSSIERSYGGLGIGLTLVKRIAELHRGSVEVRSGGKNKGTEFIVRLPIIEKGEQPLAEKAPAQAQSTSSYRILVVDDNKASAKTLGWMMKITRA